MFKVGDKVTCILYGKGEVKAVSKGLTYPVEVIFNESSILYTLNGGLYLGANPSLFHGHGTFKIEFVEDKEPEYEWQWLFLTSAGYFSTTGYFKTEESMRVNYGVNTKILYRIEESKREAKND